MRGLSLWRALLAAVLAMAALCASAASAQAAASDPLFILSPRPAPPPTPRIPPPWGTFNGPCGLGVDSAGNFYVSDYYRHAVDAFGPNGYGPPPQVLSGGLVAQLSGIDPLDGPCGLAMDASDHLYVNDYHRAVIKYGSSASFGTGTVITGAELDGTHPTGVAVDPLSGDVYVTDRTYIAVFDSSGEPVMEGGEPLRIGLGDLQDGYGLAYSQFPGTLGRLYVADAATDTVKVYDPALDTEAPVAEIDGSATPNGEFVSLRDSALAVDRVTGQLYVVDNLEPRYAEQPDAIVYVFAADGSYEGHLKYLIHDALPPGLAVDNSPAATYPAGTQGRVYVTSGNTEPASVYAYPAGAATTGVPRPTFYTVVVRSTGTGDGIVSSPLAQLECAGTCEGVAPGGAAVSLTATPDPGSAFTGWSGACSGTEPTCTVPPDAAASVRAQFELVTGPTLADGQAGPAAAAPVATSAVGRRRHVRPHRHRRHRRHGRQRGRRHHR